MNKLKSLFVSIVGNPNVGKSTLLNTLLNKKASIVSNKPQTTRTQIRGILTKGETQYVFVDTPGFHMPKNKLSDCMLDVMNDSITDVDVIMLLIDATKNITNREISLIEKFIDKNLKVFLILNKVDLLSDKTVLLKKIEDYRKLYDFVEIIPISAKDNMGVDTILKCLSEFAICGVHFFPDDMYTDQSENTMISEIVREKILFHLQQELPHSVAVVVDCVNKNSASSFAEVRCTIYCEKASHKPIIIGKNGSMLKIIGSKAREDIEKLLKCKVDLTCWVKVKKDWRNNEYLIKSFGLR